MRSFFRKKHSEEKESLLTEHNNQDSTISPAEKLVEAREFFKITSESCKKRSAALYQIRFPDIKPGVGPISCNKFQSYQLFSYTELDKKDIKAITKKLKDHIEEERARIRNTVSFMKRCSNDVSQSSPEKNDGSNAAMLSAAGAGYRVSEQLRLISTTLYATLAFAEAHSEGYNDIYTYMEDIIKNAETHTIEVIAELDQLKVRLDVYQNQLQKYLNQRNVRPQK